jgi:ABC-type phosphate transport system permease subunit
MQQPVIASPQKQSRFALWIKSLRAQHRQDLLFAGFMLLLVFVVMLIIAGVVLTLITNAWLSITQVGGSFFTNLDFDPVHNTFSFS